MNPATCPVPYYGGHHKGPCPLEAIEQISFFNRLRQTYPDTWGRLAVHIRNEDEFSGARHAQKKKLEGMVTGAVDILIPGAPAFACEMKRADPGKSTLSDEQSAYLVAARDAGAFACVAFGAAAAWEAFEEWAGVQAKAPILP